MSEVPRSKGWLPSLAAGVIIGAVEVVLAIAFAALVYGGYLAQFLAEGIGLYLLAAVLTLALFAWRAGRRGVVGSIQDAAAAVLAVVAATTAATQTSHWRSEHLRDVRIRAFLTVVAATLVVTVLCRRLRVPAREVPAGATWSDSCRTRWWAGSSPEPDGSCSRAASTWPRGGAPSCGSSRLLRNPFEIARWVPALAFGVLLLVATRIVKRPLVIPSCWRSGWCCPRWGSS